MAKREIFAELMEGAKAIKGHREGKLTLRSPRAVFACKLRINEMTLEKWEQGRARPNPQAAALVLLVRAYPDTLQRLEEVAAG